MGCKLHRTVLAAFVLMVSFYVDGHTDVSEDFAERWTMSLHRDRRQADQNETFKYYWVTQCGYSAVNIEPVSIEVRATQRVSQDVLEKTARLVHRLVSFISPTLFQRLSAHVAVGVYSHPIESPAIFSEYTPTQECRSSCVGACNRTCSDLGIPVAYQVSYGGPLVVVPSQNVDCQSSNPKRYENLLVGEFSKALYKYALTGPYREMLDESFKDAPSIWGSGIPQDKYFRQASLAWFQSTKLYRSITYGMNQCFGSALCPDERYSRNNLRAKDTKLYDALNEIYNYGRPYIHGGITLCEW